MPVGLQVSESILVKSPIPILLHISLRALVVCAISDMHWTSPIVCSAMGKALSMGASQCTRSMTERANAWLTSLA